MLQKRVNSKRKGLRREREARKIAEKEGYYVAPVKGSFGPFDFAALAKGGFPDKTLPVVVQVKANKIDAKTRRKIEEFEIMAYKQIWVKPDYKPWLKFQWNISTAKWELL